MVIITSLADIFAQEIPGFARAPELLVSVDNHQYMRPTWSPDGKKISFNSSDRRGIWIINADGTNKIKIFDDHSTGYAYQWSHDSNKIAALISMFRDRKKQNLMKIYDVNSGKYQELTEASRQISGKPIWSRDDRRIFFVNQNEIESLSISSLEKQSLPFNETFVVGQNIISKGKITNISNLFIQFKDKDLLNLELSPDGQKVVFEVMGGNLYLVDLALKTVKEIGVGYRAKWSPDNQYVVYMVSEDDGHTILTSDLYIYSITNDINYNITNTPYLLEMNPSWSPDGSYLAYDEYRSGEIYIAEIKPNIE